jgi:erythronate-4-phosphate dehydrogenase
MALEAVCRHFGRPADFTILPPPLPETTPMQGDDRKLWLYDPRRDSDALKAAPEKFEWLRGHYPLRREK